uniref:Uncharacterized protein n=1 Tax=viral metagenome TaxID=1070528 RepID=A0A6C0IH91_9ZZZZ
MAGKQTKKVFRARKRFTRRVTRGGVHVHPHSPRHMPAAEDIELPLGPPRLIRQHAMIHPPPQVPHTRKRSRSLSPRTNTPLKKRPHH